MMRGMGGRTPGLMPDVRQHPRSTIAHIFSFSYAGGGAPPPAAWAPPLAVIPVLGDARPGSPRSPLFRSGRSSLRSIPLAPSRCSLLLALAAGDARGFVAGSSPPAATTRTSQTVETDCSVLMTGIGCWRLEE